MPFRLLDSLCEGLLHFKVNFLPSKNLCLERAFEVSPLLTQSESQDRPGILAAGRSALFSVKTQSFAFGVINLDHFDGGWA